MKKSYRFLALLSALIILALLIAYLFVLPGEKKDLDLKTVQVTRRDLGSTVIATGIVKPKVGAEVKVGSRVSGVVKKLNAQIGDLVATGQVIAELDDAELQSRLKQNLAVLEKTQAELDFAAMNLNRQKSLYEAELISEYQFDIADHSHKLAAANLDQARANAEMARVQLEYTRIIAPISGVIASISTQEGETVSANLSSPTFVNIIDLDRLEVHAYVDETDIGRIVVGLEAVFTVDTYLDTEFRGLVTAIHPKAVIQDNVVNYIVTIEISELPDGRLRPEMTANVNIFLEISRGVLSLPATAVARNGAERFVNVLAEEKIQRRLVRIGRRDGFFVEILEGLEENETVIISN